MKIEKNAISQEQIDEWKVKYGHVYKTMVDGEAIIWRRLKRSEYVDLMNAETEAVETDDDRAKRIMVRQDAVVKATVLYPDAAAVERLIEDSAGFSIALSQEILDHSGFEVQSTNEL